MYIRSDLLHFVKSQIIEVGRKSLEETGVRYNKNHFKIKTFSSICFDTYVHIENFLQI